MSRRRPSCERQSRYRGVRESFGVRIIQKNIFFKATFFSFGLFLNTLRFVAKLFAQVEAREISELKDGNSKCDFCVESSLDKK
jgi:hypothetical protein